MFVRITILLLVIAAILALTHWQSTLASPPTHEPQVTLRFWNGFTGPDGRTMLRIVRRFQHDNPDIHIIMQRMDWGTYYNKLFVAGMGGRAPEVFVIQSPVLTRFARARLVRPLGDIAAEFPVDDIDPATWSIVQYDHQPVGIPLDMSILGQYYNNAMLKRLHFTDAAGNPKPPQTRDELLALLRAVKAREPANWGFVFPDTHICVFALMMQFGGRLFSDDGQTCTLDDPRNVEALAFCRQLIAEGLTPSPENTDAWIGFQQGKVATAWHGVFMLGDLQRAADLDYAGTPIPTVGPEQATWVSSHVLCLRPDLTPQQTQAAARFLRYLSDNSLDWAAAGQIPVRRSLRSSARFQSMQVQSAFARQIPYIHYEPAVPFTLEYRAEFDVALEQALRGTLPPKEALHQAADRVNQIIQHDRDLEGAGGAPMINWQRWGGYLFLLPYLVLFALFVLTPILFGLMLSFMNWEMSSTVPPSFAGASNYSHALTDPYFWKALLATLLFVVLSVPLTVIVALLLGLALAAVERRRAFYRGAILLPMMINISVAGILWRWLFNTDFGVLNAYLEKLSAGHVKIPWLTTPALAMPSIALMTLWWTVGGPSILLLAGLQQIPQHYYEAGELDGAVGFKRFWHITLPLVRPVLLFVVVMNIIGAFQVFGQTFMITHGGPELSTRVLMQYVYETSFNNYHMGYGAAMSWLLFVIIAIVSYFQFRILREKV